MIDKELSVSSQVKESREYIAYLILSMIGQDLRSTDAYKLGIIDEWGKQLRKIDKSNPREVEALNPLNKMAFMVAQLLGVRKRSVVRLMDKNFTKPENLSTDIMVIGQKDKASIKSVMNMLNKDN